MVQVHQHFSFLRGKYNEFFTFLHRVIADVAAQCLHQINEQQKQIINIVSQTNQSFVPNNNLPFQAIIRHLCHTLTTTSQKMKLASQQTSKQYQKVPIIQQPIRVIRPNQNAIKQNDKDNREMIRNVNASQRLLQSAPVRREQSGTTQEEHPSKMEGRRMSVQMGDYRVCSGLDHLIFKEASNCLKKTQLQYRQSTSPKRNNMHNNFPMRIGMESISPLMNFVTRN